MARAGILYKLLKELDLTVNKFEGEIGVSQSRVAKAIKNNSILKEDILEKISKKFPNVNPKWLETGKGEIFMKPSAFDAPAANNLPDITDDWLDKEMGNVQDHIDSKKRGKKPSQHEPPKYDEQIFDKIVLRHKAKIAALDGGLSPEQKHAYRHIWTSTPPEKLYMYILHQLDK